MSDIPFESFSTLIYRLGNPPKSNPSEPGPSRPKRVSPEKIFASWLNHLPKPLETGTGKQLFRLLFPHEGSRRRYGMKENLLAREVGKILALNNLQTWDGVKWEGEGGTGCLGREIELLMRDRIPTGTRSALTVRDLDMLLDALAQPSSFSQLSQSNENPSPPQAILTRLYRDSSLSPYSLSVLTQIILRDLRPLLCPLPKLPVRNPTTLLRISTAEAPAQLEMHSAMRAWDNRMSEMYKDGKGNLDWCADMIEVLGGGPGGEPNLGAVPAGPVLGVNVQIPKCRKGRSISDALDEFTGSTYNAPASAVWAETKYDGYRMQIHVDLRNKRQPITVFSKSKRNSTMDRLNAHALIYASLGLPIPDTVPCPIRLQSRLLSPPNSSMNRSVILEAEVVPYMEGQREGGRAPGIDEFWWLGAAGVTVGSRFASGTNDNSSERHLCLVYFDVLHLDGESLLNRSYNNRRFILESIILPIPGFSVICPRIPIPLNLGRQVALTALQSAFDASTVQREEGLVLKSSESTYCGGHRWVKLKKDYIPGLGDCIDLVLLGAGWDIDRARELRVDTSVFTTFYLGVLTNGEKVKKRMEAPHFEILFRASYGPDRTALEVYNANIRMGRWGSKPFDKDDPYKRRLLGLSWTYFMPRGMTPPSVLFETPMCAEVMGAGFQKLPWSDLYEVRWPRLQKIFEPRERSWNQALTAPVLVKTAHESLGYLNGPHLLSSPENDSVRNLWRSASSCAIDVIPDTPTPPAPRNQRPGFKRNKSAPDLVEILKASPPTPQNGSRQALTPPARYGLGFGEFEDPIQDEESGPLFMRTPVSSPAKRIGSPIHPIDSGKRKKSEWYDQSVELPRHLPTPPVSSPLANLAINRLDSSGRNGPTVKRVPLPVDGRQFRITTKVWKESGLKPLSLKSRILKVWRDVRNT